MNNKFKEISNKLNFEISPGFQEARIISATATTADTFHVLIELPKFVLISEMKLFLKAVNNIKYKTKLNFNVKNPELNIDIVFDYIAMFLSFYLKSDSILNQFPKEKFSLKDNQIIISCKTHRGEERIQLVKKDLIKLLKAFGFGDLIIRTQLAQSETNALEKAEKQYELELQTSQTTNTEEPTEIKTEKKYRKPVLTSIQECKDLENSQVIVEGEIFKKEIKVTKTGWHILELSITDYKDAIHISTFIGKEASKVEKYNDLEIGVWVQAKGKLQINTFKQNEHEIQVSTLKKIMSKTPKRTDDAPRKRIELNARTLMSTMDGIISPKDLIAQAKQFGHSAITVVDSEGSVQSFPELYNNAGDLKIIYGSSFNMIYKDGTIVSNPIEGEMSKKTYVVFDLETTGLSPIHNEIIEFGATKIVDGNIEDKKQIFIKNTKPLSKFTTELTGITAEMLENSMSEEEAMKEIVEYFGDSILVAHNASFDMGFIFEKISKYKLPKINPTVVDTLTAARFQEPDQKRFSLKYVSGRNGYSYDSSVAHRADYDADILAGTWITMMAKFKRMDITDLITLANSSNSNLYKAAFSKEISIIAKNNKGLKELFKLVSLAHTEQFYNNPKLFWEDLPKSDNLLIGSGGLRSELVERMLRGTTQSIKDEIKKYDYIEVQPLRNYIHEINRGNITEKDLIQSIKLIISEAKVNGIPVVATGDIRYLNDEDSLYHSVYINAKGLGGRRHYLFKYNELHPKYPVQSYLTTQEMKEAFAFLDDDELINEIVVKNTNSIADQIEKCEVIKKELYTPKIDNSDELLTEIVWKTAKEQYGEELPVIVKERIEKELGNIIKYGFGVIYYIAHQLVAKSLEDGYLVGSRGSVGSSLVATLAGITEVNPLPPHYVCKKCQYSEFHDSEEYKSGYDLPDKNCSNCENVLYKEGHHIPFETFLGFKANKVPDIDLNFSGDYQPTIHNEVKKFFGDFHTFRAGTISTVAEKTAYGYVKAWAEETGKQISKPFIEFLAKNISGTKRTTGQHPGGIIVIPKTFDVEDFCPINYPANDINAAWKTTHFDFHAIHDNVLKLDLLGHDDPTAIKMLERLTNVVATDIPNYDQKVLSLFSSTEELKIDSKDISGEVTGAMGIPEFGTKFVRGMLKSVKVKSFSDLVSISGLSHGTDVWANNGEILVKKQGKSISELISCRDDIMTDLIKKGMDPLESFVIMEQVRKGKSITEEQEKIMIEANIEPWYIESCKKIKYMFPKAHATAYVKMAWRIAWFKLYHPLAYYATYFTTRADVSDIETLSKNKEKIKTVLVDFKSRRYVRRGEGVLTKKEENLIPILEIAEELYARGFKIDNISLEKSEAHEWIISKETNSIIPPFSSLDGLGDAVASKIIIARQERSFSSIHDLRKRTSINKTVIAQLEKMSVLKGLDETNQLTLF